MGRRAAQKRPYTVYSDRGVAFINATIGGRRVRESLGVPFLGHEFSSPRDVRAAEKAAEERYAELAAGRVLDARKTPRILTAHTLHELCAMWLAESKRLYPDSYKARIVYGRHIETWADVGADKCTPLERIVDDDGPRRYMLARLQQVGRDTVRKELSSGVFALLEWARLNGYLADLPPRVKVPKGVTGTRSGTQREAPVEITPAEARAIIDRLPEWAARGGRKGTDKRAMRNAFVVRDRFVFAYETGLRPGTLNRMRVPQHWRPGSTVLLITDAIDKARFGRRVPLTAAAIAVLERCAPESGLVFGRHDYRTHLKAAALAVLPPEKARDFAAYDFRHGRTTHALDASGDLLGVAHLVGHKQVTTTNRYLHSSEDHARNVVQKVSNVSATECEGRDLNPHESYPASTSRQRERRKDKTFSDSDVQAASENTEKTTGDDAELSASRQQLSELAGALAVQEAVWDAFDAFAFAEEDEP